MKRLYLPLLAITLTLGLHWSCGTTKNAEAIALKSSQFETLKELVAGKSFEISVETAYPMNTYAVMQVTSALLRNTGNAPGRINVMGNGDFIKINGDTVQGELSYFGEVRNVGVYTPSESGINFDGEPNSYEVTENEKKQSIRVEFDIKSKLELYTVVMELYPNNKATVFINSMNRTSIRYDGTVKELEESDT